MYTPLKRNSNNLSNLTTSYSLQALEEPKTLLEDFLAFRQTTRTTAEAYTKALKVFFSFLNERGISAPTEADLLAYRETLFNKSLQATTIASYINAVKQFFSWAEERGLYRNIARNIKGAKVNNYYHKKDYLSVEQAKSVLSYYSGETLEALRNYALILLALTTGLRVIELSRADKKDIDISAGSKVLYIQGKGRQDKGDFVKIPEPVEEALKNYLKARGETSPDAPLFASHSDRNNGERLTTRTISGIIKKALRGVGLDSKRLTAHSTRHTFITLLLKNGSTLEQASLMARHRSINTTMIYNHDTNRESLNGEATLCDLLLN